MSRRLASDVFPYALQLCPAAFGLSVTCTLDSWRVSELMTSESFYTKSVHLLGIFCANAAPLQICVLMFSYLIANGTLPSQWSRTGDQLWHKA